MWLSKQNEVKRAGSRKFGRQVRAAIMRMTQTGIRVINEWNAARCKPKKMSKSGIVATQHKASIHLGFLASGSARRPEKAMCSSKDGMIVTWHDVE